MVLADNFGHIVDVIDANVKSGYAWPGAGLLFAYAFAGQIYCDFSAYTDIARGSAKLVGIELVLNFRTPYFANSPSDFWRRWHISLSTWLRDYLYIPLGGNRHGRWAEYRNLMLTMTLGGLWHGAGVLFIAWGVFHGLILAFQRVFPYDKKLEDWLGVIGRAIAILITSQLVVFSWILFRADTTTFLPLMSSIGTLFDAKDLYLFNMHARGVILLMMVVLITDFIGYIRGREFVAFFATLNPYLCAAAAVICYFATTIVGKRESTQFIYFAF